MAFWAASSFLATAVWALLISHRIAKALIDRYKAFKTATERIAELVLRVEGVWLKTEYQVGALQHISDSLSLSLVTFLYECVQRLDIKLLAASAEIEGIAKTKETSDHDKHDDAANLKLSPLQRLRYTSMEKHLKKTIQSLESWHAIFDPSWLLLTLPATHSIDDALTQQEKQSEESEMEAAAVLGIRALLKNLTAGTSQADTVFRGPAFLTEARHPLLYSSLTSSALSDSGRTVILDTTTYPADADQEDVVADVRSLAQILGNSQPITLGLLKCVGVLRVSAEAREGLNFQLIYTLPAKTSSPASLRSLLLQEAPSLDAKYAVARALARGVTAVHSAKFVHKSVRPENILVLDHDDHDGLPGAFLVGFERFRAARSSTALTMDMIWYRNLYRHPTRQGKKPEDIIPYIMQHDIYSLGVCLLELGLWSSFLTPDSEPLPGAVLDIKAQLEMSNITKAAWEIRDKLLNLAGRRLPQMMGRLYTSLVISCLTCLDSGESNIFGLEQDLWDEDGVSVGVAFIEKILQGLESINVAEAER